jgi:hypothetical protein
MSSSKKLTCKGTLRQVFVCLWPRGQNTIHPLPYELFTCSVLIHTGKWGRGGGGELNQREEREATGESMITFLG